MDFWAEETAQLLLWFLLIKKVLISTLQSSLRLSMKQL